MRQIRSVDTKPELYFRKLLFARGFRYRLYSRKLPGKPDLYLKKFNLAVFVNGCFWHHHSCRAGYMPKSRQDYWQEKFERNAKRDANVKKELKSAGIRQLVIWECTLKEMEKNPEAENRILQEVISFIENTDQQFLEI